MVLCIYSKTNRDKTQKQKEEYIDKTWTDPGHPATFVGPEKLYKIIKKEGKFNIGRGKLKKFLAKKDTYSVQKYARRNFPRKRHSVGW